MKRGWVRIIGGEWRGRRLQVADVPGLRPTPDRVRETLFNWLAPKIVGARCLDAFAGTGVLGFEAVSRGAAHVTMIEASLPAWRLLLLSHSELLTSRNVVDIVDIRRGTQPNVLSGLSGPFDLVFLDPPWQQQDLLMDTFSALLTQKKLSPSAWVCLEMPISQEMPTLPDGWEILKETRAGEVHLVVVSL